LRSGSQIVGVRGATVIALTRGPALLQAEHGEALTLSGLTLDGGAKALPENHGLVHLTDVRKLRISDCEIVRAGGNGIALHGCDGVVTLTTISDAADNALFSNDSRGLVVTGNTIRKSGNGGIRIWQSERRSDGSLVADNRIEDTRARAGGTGQNGNAVNIFRAGDVTVRSNVIRNAAFTAIRGNSASNLQIIGNNCAGLDEVALYVEFSFENAVVADNIVDGAGVGVSVTNFKEGGRLASVRGNILRNLSLRMPGQPPESQGVGVSVEADTAVAGNVIETASTAGITLGWGQYLRNVAVTGNVVRTAGIGIAVSVVAGAGDAVISGNMIAGARRGAILGMEWHKPVSADLAKDGAAPYPQLTVADNKVS
jgi:uncharacterized secreted repeat protein (TIGR03808 family)